MQPIPRAKAPRLRQTLRRPPTNHRLGYSPAAQQYFPRLNDSDYQRPEPITEAGLLSREGALRLSHKPLARRGFNPVNRPLRTRTADIQLPSQNAVSSVKYSFVGGKLGRREDTKGILTSSKESNSPDFLHRQTEVAAGVKQTPEPLATAKLSTSSKDQIPERHHEPVYHAAPDTMFQPFEFAHGIDGPSNDALQNAYAERPWSLYPQLKERLMAVAATQFWGNYKHTRIHTVYLRSSASDAIHAVCKNDSRFDFWHPPMTNVFEAKEHVLKYERYRTTGHFFFKTAVSLMLGRDLMDNMTPAMHTAMSSYIEKMSDLLHLVAALRLDLNRDLKLTIDNEAFSYINDCLKDLPYLATSADRHIRLQTPVHVSRAIDQFRDLSAWYDSYSSEPDFANSGGMLLVRSMPILLGRKIIADEEAKMDDDFVGFVFNNLLANMRWFEHVYADLIFTSIHLFLDATEKPAKDARAGSHTGSAQVVSQANKEPSDAQESVTRSTFGDSLSNAAAEGKAPRDSQIGKLLQKSMWSRFFDSR
ncbi:hypothetical protein ABW21_db0204072 [Orbilia brochopaga]|nr:hypothetical protein ABW21_db0204072 [Drechslerella brochopaga]